MVIADDIIAGGKFQCEGGSIVVPNGYWCSLNF